MNGRSHRQRSKDPRTVWVWRPGTVRATVDGQTPEKDFTASWIVNWIKRMHSAFLIAGAGRVGPVFRVSSGSPVVLSKCVAGAVSHGKTLAGR
jgi:hypothetical protein